MRTHLSIKPNGKLLAFNYQDLLTRQLHRWLGFNSFHDGISLYSFSWFFGGKGQKNGIAFDKECRFFISSCDTQFLKQLIQGIQANPEISFVGEVYQITIQKAPVFKKPTQFFLASPILIKKKDDKGEKHLTFRDEESNELLTNTLKTKLRRAGLDDEGVEVKFATNYHSPKTKIVRYKNIGNKVNICPVIVDGTTEQIQFAWDVGLGNSTGIGFGALK